MAKKKLFSTTKTPVAEEKVTEPVVEETTVKEEEIKEETLATEETVVDENVESVSIETVSVGSLPTSGVAYTTGQAISNMNDVNNYLQTIYDLGYRDGKVGNPQRELRIDKDTGRMKF